MLQRTFKAFQYRDFRLMWLGACTSTIGTWMHTTAQNWLVLDISQSAFYLGLDAFLSQIPIFLFTLVGGVVADRIDRRFILVGSQLVQMSCAILLGTLFLVNSVRIEYILMLSFIVGTAQAFGGPAYQALIPSLVKQEDLPNAIALNSIQFNLGRMVGPALGLLAMTSLGPAWCFYLNGFSYLAVIATLLTISSSFKPKAQTVSVAESMKQGFRFIRARDAMGSLIVIAFLMTMLGITMMTFLPVFAKNVFHRDVSGYTLLLEVAGAGAIAGALAVATFSGAARQGRAAVINLVLVGMSMVAFSFSTSLVVSCVILFIGSAALMSVFALISSLVQAITPDDMRGRVMSVYNMAFRGGMPFGSLISGKFVEGYGAPAVVGLNGLLMGVLGLYFLVVRKKVARL
ncbi:MAG: MFS transporter [Bryobacteraceae bacterium]